ncbi:MAG: nucleoside deaminase [Phycisphaerales bacterium]|nr:nucleoside deaminase [Phycisphaerales bacterium]
MIPMTQDELDRRFMEIAIDVARRALPAEDVPIGAIVVHEGRIIGRGHNERERLADPTAHAEILALSAASQHLKRWRLDGCTLYVTLEPCPMCAGAIVLARMSRLVFGAFDPKAGACGSLYEITTDARLNHRVVTLGGVLNDRCADLLREFFRDRRVRGEK